MIWYCARCGDTHDGDSLCPHHAAQLQRNPGLLAEAANFTVIAGQYHLVTSQALDGMAQGVNRLAGTRLAYEGTHQMVRDVQVFRQLNADAYSRCGVFSSAEGAREYLNNASQGQLDTLTRKLNGTAQEVDWLRMKQGRLSSLLEKSKLLGEESANAPGVDGTTINRFTGKTIENTSVKAAESSKGLGTNVNDVLKALKKGTLSPDDTVAGVRGTERALEKALDQNIEKALREGDFEFAETLKAAKQNLKVEELNGYEDIKTSTERLKDKITNGEATASVTGEQVIAKATQGAVIGAAVALTVSGVSNYLRYRNGEITESEAFEAVAQDTFKGAIVGAALGGVSCFLPPGAVGFVAGLAIGVYIGTVCQSVLDEVFGKGEYKAILDASGYIYGMSVSLRDCVAKVARDEKAIAGMRVRIKERAERMDENQVAFDDLMNER